jgi:gas vesicle protein
MSERDEGPYIVIERGGGQVGSFLIGALLGAGIALLLAPKSGKETQEELKEHGRRIKASAEDRIREAQRHLEERLESAREGVKSRIDGVKDAVDAGRAAARDARTELERKLERSKAAYRAGIDAARQAVTAPETPEIPESTGDTEEDA